MLGGLNMLEAQIYIKKITFFKQKKLGGVVSQIRGRGY